MCTSQFVQSLNGAWDMYWIEHHLFEKDPQEPATRYELSKRGYPCVKACVPGNYELDLLRAGQIQDPFVGDRVLELQNFENRHLWYCRTFHIEADPGMEYMLCFDGIDTIAEIYLNGQYIGRADNMLIPHTYDVVLQNGENELVVHIIPAMIEARKYPVGAGTITHLTYNADSLHIRKAPHMYGWDIMPRILSGGLWKDVTLCTKKRDCFTETYLYTAKATREDASVCFYYSLCALGDRIQDYRICLTGHCGDSCFVLDKQLWSSSGRFVFHVPNPRLWWTKDMGSPDLYHVCAELYRGETLLDSVEFTYGIRCFTLERTSVVQENGEGKFLFRLNGEPLFVRGTNWTPLDAFHSRDKERMPKVLALLDDIGCNLVRCWGGNVYPDDTLYDFCDRHGIAVWQDFAMACAFYPQDRDFAAQMETEIACVVKRLRQHASLAIWVGDNECDITCRWTSLSPDPNDNALTRKLLPEVLRRHDPARLYLPSSPYIDETAHQMHATALPEDHLWKPELYFKSEFFTKAKFASEVGYYACPSPESVRRFITPNACWPWKNNREWLVHATSMEGREGAPYTKRVPLLSVQIHHFLANVPDTLEDFALASQITQAEALKYFIESYRCTKWEHTGIIWWNLVDGWTLFSDSVVDYYFTKKLAYHTVKTSQQAVCLMLREEENRLVLMGANEHLAPETITFTVTEASKRQHILSGTTMLSANAAMEIGGFSRSAENMRLYVIEWQCKEKSGRNYYISGKPPFDYSVLVRQMENAGLLMVEGFGK